MTLCYRILAVMAVAWSCAAVPNAQQAPRTFQFASVRTVSGECPREQICIGSSSLPPPTTPSTLQVLPGGRFEARNTNLESLVRLAFGFEGADSGARVVEIPRINWPGRDRFDVTGGINGRWSTPPPGERVPPELRVMLRSLLEDRFALKTGIEMRKIDVYGLRLSNASGNLGPGLRVSANGCLGPYTVPLADGTLAPCPFRMEPDRIEAGAVTMADVARLLSRGFFLDRLLVDDTGLQGTYDLAFEIDGLARSDRRPSAALVEALQQQLGLKLQKAKLPIPTLVVHEVKRPQED
jgi:uncharacterized protein (TIGR03435 family)